LGNLYNLGLGVPANQVKAYAWTSLAAANGDKDAQARLQLMTNALSPADKATAEQEVAGVMASRGLVR
jgi:TPR repeat protein